MISTIATIIIGDNSNMPIKLIKKMMRKISDMIELPNGLLLSIYYSTRYQIIKHDYYSPKLIICDLHGYELWEAKEEIVSKLEECRIRKGGKIKIIHGHQHGQVLRNYFRSDLFIIEMNKLGYDLEMKDPKYLGSTTFMFS